MRCPAAAVGAEMPQTPFSDNSLRYGRLRNLPDALDTRPFTGGVRSRGAATPQGESPAPKEPSRDPAALCRLNMFNTFTQDGSRPQDTSSGRGMKLPSSCRLCTEGGAAADNGADKTADSFGNAKEHSCGHDDERVCRLRQQGSACQCGQPRLPLRLTH